MMEAIMSALPAQLLYVLDIKDLLVKAVRWRATDLFIQSASPPLFRINGKLQNTGDNSLPFEEVEYIAQYLAPPDKWRSMLATGSVDFSYEVSGLARFRVHISKSQGKVTVAMRVISHEVPKLDTLGLPDIVKKIACYERGLVLLTGRTGSGKSTSLASIAQFIADRFKKYIVTIEDPIEYTLRSRQGLVLQKEIGRDTKSFAQSLRGILRENPDVIVVGEMRDRETIETALLAAETGHLVISTLHTLDARETVNRIVAAFDPSQQKQIRVQLASILRAVISQRLIPQALDDNFIPAVEVLINNERVHELIMNPDRTHEITRVIEDSYTTFGMQSFDQSLMQLLMDKKIDYKTAVQHATKPTDFELKCSGIHELGRGYGIGNLHSADKFAVPEVLVDKLQISEDLGDDDE